MACDQIKEDKVGEACGRSREMHTGFWWGNLKDGECFEDLGTDWSITLNGS
jgi:hypothetical protein